MKTAPPIRSPTGLGMIWDSACPLSCRAPHEGGCAKTPILDFRVLWDQEPVTLT